MSSKTPKKESASAKACAQGRTAGLRQRCRRFHHRTHPQHEALRRCGVPAQPPHAAGAVREGHLDRDRVGRPGGHAGGPARAQSLRRPAGAGRSRPGALQLRDHHGVPGRALPAPAADAGRSDQPRPGAPDAVAYRSRLVQPAPHVDRARKKIRRRRRPQDAARRSDRDCAAVPAARVRVRRRARRWSTARCRCCCGACRCTASNCRPRRGRCCATPSACSPGRRFAAA